MNSFVAEVTDVISRTPSVKSFRLKTKEPMAFDAGQFVSVCLNGEKELTRSLSLSNAPTENGYLEVTKRITDSRFSQLLDQAKPGIELTLKGPMGRFSFKGENKKIALVSGGIGITPLRSMAKLALDNYPDTSVKLLYCNRTLDEIAFKEEFEEMAKQNSNFEVYNTLTRADAGWKGRRGRIDAALVRELIPDFKERTFYTCGPKQMVASIAEMLLEELELPKEQVQKENFTGY